MAPVRCGSNLKSVISEHMFLINKFMSTSVELLSDEYHRTPLVIS